MISWGGSYSTAASRSTTRPIRTAGASLGSRVSTRTCPGEFRLRWRLLPSLHLARALSWRHVLDLHPPAALSVALDGRPPAHVVCHVRPQTSQMPDLPTLRLRSPRNA